MSDSVLLEHDDAGVRTLTLHRPEKRNALDARLVEALTEAIHRAAEDVSVRVVVLTGAGADFCSGADLAELEALSTHTDEENLADALRLGELFLSMRRSPLPIVAAVRGRALAGGCGLACSCDVVLADEGAQFGFPEIHLGFVPAMVMALLRRKVTEGRAFDLVTRGHRISAAEAHRIGLVTERFEASSFEVGATAYVRALAERPPGALAKTKRLLYELEDLSVEQGVRRGAEVNVEARRSEECREGVHRFLNRD